MKTCRFYPVAGAVVMAGLMGCAARGVPVPTAAALVPLFAAAAADVARMEQDTNEARFDALTAMLSSRRIAFAVEDFTIEPRKTEPRTRGRNIVVTIAGRTPEIIIGAHYDAARLQNGTLSRGAVDNAASTIVLVRLAEALLTTRPKTQIRIVFFDMEELGLIGSSRYVQTHQDRPARAMINLDVNGFGDTVIFGPRTNGNGTLFQALRATCAAIARGCAELQQMPPSDDMSFRKGNIPAVSIATVPAVQAHQLWLLMNGGKQSGLESGFTPEMLKTIHSPSDTSALIDSEAMAQAYRVVLGLIRALE